MIATSTTISTTTIVQQNNLGNHDALNGVIWDFSVSYAAGTGYTYTLSRVGQAANTVQWIAPYQSVSQLRSFNAIELYAHATGNSPGNPYSSGYVNV
jgi:hypothetical protein